MASKSGGGYGMAADEQAISKATDPGNLPVEIDSYYVRKRYGVHKNVFVSSVVGLDIPNNEWYSTQQFSVPITTYNLPMRCFLEPRGQRYSDTSATYLLEYLYYKLKHVEFMVQDILCYVRDPSTGCQLMQDPILEWIHPPYPMAIGTAEETGNHGVAEFEEMMIKTSNGGVAKFGWDFETSWRSPYPNANGIIFRYGKSAGTVTGLSGGFNAGTLWHQRFYDFLKNENFGPLLPLNVGSLAAQQYTDGILPGNIHVRVRNYRPPTGMILTISCRLKITAIWEQQHKYGHMLTTTNEPTFV